MIAAINKQHECVWGIGRTVAEARQDAYDQLETKSKALRQEGIEPLEFAPLKPDADLTTDGISMYEDVIFETDTAQLGLDI